MGVVNVTPDSFSDGGQWYGADAAIAHGLALAAKGADIVDVGGEPTRPGAQRIDEAEELRRIGPVVTELVRAGLTVSIDTMRARVAGFAVDAGARLGNGVNGGVADPVMPRRGWGFLRGGALARPQPRQVRARGLRRRGDRGPRRTGRTSGRGGARRGGPGEH